MAADRFGDADGLTDAGWCASPCEDRAEATLVDPCPACDFALAALIVAN